MDQRQKESGQHRRASKDQQGLQEMMEEMETMEKR
jgi:hypothetical protein